jgi:hypothetical protein
MTAIRTGVSRFVAADAPATCADTPKTAAAFAVLLRKSRRLMSGMIDLRKRFEWSYEYNSHVAKKQGKAESG